MKFKLPVMSEVKTAEDAKQLAIEWQQWQSNTSLSYNDLFKYQAYFHILAKKFRLVGEFKENGIL